MIELKINKPMIKILARLVRNELGKADSLLIDAHKGSTGDVRKKVKCDACHSSIERLVAWNWAPWVKEQREYVKLLEVLHKKIEKGNS